MRSTKVDDSAIPRFAAGRRGDETPKGRGTEAGDGVENISNVTTKVTVCKVKLVEWALWGVEWSKMRVERF